MIITESFVMLNFPKTGSTFARTVIKQLYAKYETMPYKAMMKLGLVQARNMFELLVPARLNENLQGKSQHGKYREIPPEHLHKRIVSIMRNPFDLYVSAYLFRWWERFPIVPVEKLRAIWPHFPDLSFHEFYDMLHMFAYKEKKKAASPKVDLGYSAIKFIQFYFRDPHNTMAIFDDAYLSQKRYVDDMADVKFLRQENLNQELYDFLLSIGYPQKDIRFIENAERLNIAPRLDSQKRASDFYTPELMEQVYKRDKLLFTIFPEYKNSFMVQAESLENL